MKLRKSNVSAVVAMCVAMSAGIASVQASSHREAPFITELPKVDGTDFYMFNSYEGGRSDYVTIIANYFPLQDAYGGPNYFALDPDALYEIHIDNNGDAREDITFQFNFQLESNDVQLDVGGTPVSIPLINTGSITAIDSANLHRNETYRMNIVRGDRRSGQRQSITNVIGGSDNFGKPVDNIGNKSLPDYDSYANSFIHDINIPGCNAGRVFVGQRREGFAVNLGEVFDLVNTNPLGDVNGETNTIADKNVTTIALEVPKSCLVGSDNVIGGWTTASLRQARVLNRSPRFANGKPASVEGGAWTQVSRLGHPLVNEVVIGLKDKDRFNASEPVNDGHPVNGFGTYVTNPTLPELIEILFPVEAPNLFPRMDLVEIFLTGIDGLNKPATVTQAEMLRLNVTIPAVGASAQNSLGALAGDTAGFPNGRRPGDDVVDISLRAVMGARLDATVAPDGQLPYTDGAEVNAGMFSSSFPYLNTPVAGSPSN